MQITEAEGIKLTIELLGQLSSSQIPSPNSQLRFQVEVSQNDRPSPLRILLAEDIPLNQKLALRILKRLGYNADLATNGIEVLDALGRQVYDVVFMDIQMPKMDGLETTRRIRQELPQDRHPWIIALTANTAIGDRDACLTVGMNDYLKKPIDVEALKRSLLQCPISDRSLERKSS